MTSAGSASTKGHGAFVIPSLDGLRAVSFLLVFLGHSGFPGIPGGFGVTVFFFLSGYLITTLLRLEVKKHGAVSLRSFYLRRALRIWPPFYLVLLTAVLLTWHRDLPGRLDAPSVFAQTFHYCNYWIVDHGWRGIPAGTGVYWSLAVEEHFYLLFPGFYALLVRAGLSGKKQQGVFLGICALVLIWRCVLVMGFGANLDRTYIATDTRLDSMLFGCALAVSGNPMLDVAKRRIGRADLLFLGGGIVALLLSFSIRNGTFRETFRYTLQGLGLYPVFITAVRFPEWGPYKLLNLRWVKFIGTLSFSLYLVHQVVIYAIFERWQMNEMLTSPLSLAVSVGIASVIWYFIEEPCAVIRRRLAASPAIGKAAEARIDGVPS